MNRAFLHISFLFVLMTPLVSIGQGINGEYCETKKFWGYVFDSETKERIPGAEVIIEDVTFEEDVLPLFSITTNEVGEYEFKYDPRQYQKIRVIALKPGYTTFEFKITLRPNNWKCLETGPVKLPLDPLKDIVE